jgi:hypothetical protein
MEDDKAIGDPQGTVPDGPWLPELSMPAAEAGELRDRYRAARCILEYGSGGSTVFAAAETRARIVSIESDAAWAARLRQSLADAGLMRDGIDIRHADIGPTKEWGMPKTHNDWRKYWRLPMGYWQEPDRMDPDLMLIDGRFRLGCFLSAVLCTRVPLTVLWDDYQGRGGYAAAERWFPVAAMTGRMARFEIEPRRYGNAEFAEMLGGFFSSR